jgi:hypothetical protein
VNRILDYVPTRMFRIVEYFSLKFLLHMTQIPPKQGIITINFRFPHCVTMSGTRANNDFEEWGSLFGDPNDQSLSNSTRNECLALLTQNEISSQAMDSSNIDSPNKRQFLERARMIQTLSHATVEKKKKVQSMLCMDYLSSKRGAHARWNFYIGCHAGR